MKLFNRVTLSSSLAALLLAGCGGGGGGGGGTTSPSLGGVAAVGAPIVGGTVTVACAGGSAMTATTAAGGTWQVTSSGQTLPCAVQISGGTAGGVANTTPYHSIAITFGTVNITPLTDLVVANLVGSAPATWFTSVTPNGLLAVTPGQVAAALQVVSDALGMTAVLAGANPLTANFVPTNGELLDDVLEALAAAGATHQALLALASNVSFSAPIGFNFLNAYATVVAHGGGSGDGSGAGSGTLRVGISVAGQTTTFDVAGVDAPATQSEFCDELTADPTFTGIGASGGGTLTITSCAFSGNVGTIGANLSVQGQSLPYTITYTYL
ncbi:MAG: hypothetical protein KBF63_10095 [Rhodoferax sp.]|jgi:hypothetical protein|nr:hypothetical protein [Rhodoferax sp.]MBP9929614.1 hypothetical protein [Rhodoferax sp.]HQX59044.1 hypothetical protein [Burkholderiaceae bacterium]HQZ07468.1 hypothetical protein [Burkholderiaceae bacterium]HRA63337.1 hypothetical protein [Burkholderiaceae bacterium]